MSGATVSPRPLILSDWEARAAAEDRLSLIVRPIVPQPVKVGGFWTLFEAHWSMDSGPIPCAPGHSLSTKNPFGQRGGRLWVKESFAYGMSTKSGMAYKATSKRSDFEDGTPRNFEDIDWKPSVIMPRWASRVTYENTCVRVMRVQEMDGQMAMRCGIELEGIHRASVTHEWESSREEFVRRWNARYAKRCLGWDANPWVWAAEMRRVEG